VRLHAVGNSPVEEVVIVVDVSLVIADDQVVGRADVEGIVVGNGVLDDAVAARVEQANALRPRRVRGILGLVPVAAVEGRVVELAALDDDAFERLTARVDGRVAVEPEAGLGIEL
jgi:hypothetical protein